MQKLVHCCNWLHTETQCKIISVQQIDLSVSICYRHSNTSSCIAGKDQRSAVAIFLTCMSVRVCRPKLFKNLCLSLVSGVCPLLFLGLHPWSPASSAQMRPIPTRVAHSVVRMSVCVCVLSTLNLKFRCRRTACVEQFTGCCKTDHQLRTV